MFCEKNLFCESKKLLKQVDDITSKTNSKKIKFLIILQTKKDIPTLTWYGILDWSLFVLCLKISFFFIIEEMSSCLKWLLMNSKCCVTLYKRGCIHKSFKRNWLINVKVNYRCKCKTWPILPRRFCQNSMFEASWLSHWFFWSSSEADPKNAYMAIFTSCWSFWRTLRGISFIDPMQKWLLD